MHSGEGRKNHTQIPLGSHEWLLQHEVAEESPKINPVCHS